MTPHLRGMVPLVPVSDIAASLGFSRDVLRFREIVASPENGFAMVGRDGARLGLQSGNDAEAMAATGRHIAALVLVDDLPGYRDEIAAACAGLPAGRVRPPFRQPYGVREFHIKDPDGFLMLFSETTDIEKED